MRAGERLSDNVNGFFWKSCLGPHRSITSMGTLHAPASKPGGDLLFHCLSNSTIGAVRFHGRVRDGIGWVTDAMATKLWGRRIRQRGSLEIVHKILAATTAGRGPSLSLMVGFIKRE